MRRARTTAPPLDPNDLEAVVIEAYYLGHAMKSLGARRNFLLATMTRLAANAVLTWARIVSTHMEGPNPLLRDRRRRSVAPQQEAK